MSVAEYYDPESRWGRAFGVIDRVNYSPPEYKHRAQDLRKLDPTGSFSVGTVIVSLSPGRISHHYRKPATGLEVVVDTGRGRGRYEIHCHSADAEPVGAQVGAGQRVARNAVLGERTGTAWGGPHDHFVISDYPDAAHVPSRPVYDPREFIRDALTTPAGGPGSPFAPPASNKSLSEEDEMIPLRTAYFRGTPGTQEDTILVVDVKEHTFYRVASTLQLDFIKQTAGAKVEDISGVQSFDLIRGFREI